MNNNKKKISLIGFPFDKNYTFHKGTGEAPNKIREALNSYSTNLSTEDVVDLGEYQYFNDEGNVELNNYFDIEVHIDSLLEKKQQVIALGGEHSITFPIIKAYAKKYNNLNILHLDAHPDLYDDMEGNPYSHACPFARIMENNLAKRLVQVGIRTMNPHQLEQAERFNVEVFNMKNWREVFDVKFDGPVYLSLDMDVLDPAFAPGISHYEPGGLSTRDVLSVIQNIEANIVGADIVELNPVRDLNGMTAMVAAKFLKEIINKMIVINSGC